MATIEHYIATITLQDSRQKETPFSFRTTKALAEAYWAAADATARGLTVIGVAFNKMLALSACTALTRAVYLVGEPDNAAPPAADDKVYNYDKLGVSVRAGIDNYVQTIPGRDGTAYTVGPDGVTVNIVGADATTEVTEFITAFEAAAIFKNGSAGNVQKMYVQQ